MLNPYASLHSDARGRDDARGRVDALLHILSVHPCLQSTVDSEAPGLDDGLVHLRVCLIYHQVCLPCVDICSPPPVPQVCLELSLARSITAPTLFAARNILNGGGRLAIVQPNQHSGDAPLRRPKFDRSTLLASTPLQSLHSLAQSIDFGIVLRMAFLQLLHRSSRVRDRLNNFSRFSHSLYAHTEVLQGGIWNETWNSNLPKYFHIHTHASSQAVGSETHTDNKRVA